MVWNYKGRIIVELIDRLFASTCLAKSKIFVSTVFIAVLLVGCGGDESDEEKPESQGSGLLDGAGNADGSGEPDTEVTLGVSPYDPTYCESFVTAASDILGNMYSFEAPGNNCFGILGDGAQRKSVPLYLSGNANSDIVVGATVKLHNSTPEVSDFRDLVLTFDLTNTSSLPVCFVGLSGSGLSLFDEEGQEIALLGADSYLDGILYLLDSSLKTDTCLMPGQTISYVDHVDGIPVSVIENAAFAQIDPIEVKGRGATLIPSLAVTEMVSESPGLFVRFVNTSGSAIDISWINVNFFDAEGFAVHSGNLFLVEGEDGIGIVESGASFEASSNLILRNSIWPARAIKAVMHLDWDVFE